jgi:hypothetical protein
VGLYLRKSVRVGPFRFNLSGSGIGVSCGVPGLRVGVGPRGNYIHAGRGGIYYRKTISGTGPTRQQRQPLLPSAPPEYPEPAHDATLGDFQTIDAGTSIDMQDVTSKSLLNELNEKRAKQRFTPWVVLAAIVGCGALYANDFIAWEIAIVFAISVPVIAVAALRDVIKKTAVLLYELDAELALAYGELSAAFDRAAASERIWHVRSRASVLDRKYHAGAGSVLETDNATLIKTSPAGVKTNVAPLAIRMPKRAVYLFPDRALIFDAEGVGAVNYQELQLETDQSTFITGDTIAPRDATVVEYTWRYVNKGGGPDRRFANNPQLPVIATRDLSLRTRSGLNVTLKFSNVASADGLQDSMRTFAAMQHEIVAGTNGQTVSAAPAGGEPAQTKSGREVVFAWVLVCACVSGISAVIALHGLHISPINTGARQAPASRAEHGAGASVSPVVSAPHVNAVTVMPMPTRVESSKTFSLSASPSPMTAARSTDQFVTLTRSITISTPVGRVVLHKGTRLPVTGAKRDSLVVRYFDGRDYEISLSAVNWH